MNEIINENNLNETINANNIEQTGCFIQRRGLLFETASLVAGHERYDITVILLWLPNSVDEPMLIVDWHYGDDDSETSLQYIDNWLSTKSDDDIRELMMLQDMTAEQDALLNNNG